MMAQEKKIQQEQERKRKGRAARASRGALAAAAAAILCAACLSGCGRQEEIPAAYSNTESEFGLAPQEKEAAGVSFFASSLCVTDGSTASGEENGYTSSASAVFNITGREVVYSDNLFEKLYPASTTKVMTAIVALKYGNLSDQLTVSETALELESGSSVCGLKAGDVLTLEQALYGLLIESGNDAANAIAEHISGSQEAFVEVMNQEARALGATDTHFVNPSGLHDPDHYTTAYDLYLMFQAAIQNETFLDIISQTSYQTSYTDAQGERKSANWKTTNLYLNGETAAPDTIQVIGGKTGTTSDAGSCLILLSQNAVGEQDISIVLKSQDRTTLYTEMTDLLSKTVK